MAARTPFKQRDVVRLIRAAQSAGIEVGGVSIDPTGKIEIRKASCCSQTDAELDEELSQFVNRRHG